MDHTQPSFRLHNAMKLYQRGRAERSGAFFDSFMMSCTCSSLPNTTTEHVCFGHAHAKHTSEKCQRDVQVICDLLGGVLRLAGE